MISKTDISWLKFLYSPPLSIFLSFFPFYPSKSPFFSFLLEPNLKLTANEHRVSKCMSVFSHLCQVFFLTYFLSFFPQKKRSIGSEKLALEMWVYSTYICTGLALTHMWTHICVWSTCSVYSWISMGHGKSTLDSIYRHYGDITYPSLISV